MNIISVNKCNEYILLAYCLLFMYLVRLAAHYYLFLDSNFIDLLP